MPLSFQGFISANFPPPVVSFPGPPDGYLYVLFWNAGDTEVPFYVGQTNRLSGRIKDYCSAQFSACTDFRVGEAARYFIGTKRWRVVVKYRPSTDARQDEYNLIRELQLSGFRLLNDLLSYDYRVANVDSERSAVQTFCEVMIKNFDLWSADSLACKKEEGS
jgi:hypothetical protein